MLWVAQSSSTVTDEDGLDLYEVVHLVDITASKSRERTLARDALFAARPAVRPGQPARAARAPRHAPRRRTGRRAVLRPQRVQGRERHRWARPGRPAARRGGTPDHQLRLRAGDLAARYGGDEFVVLSPGLSAEDAEQLRRRIVEAVAAPLPDDLAGVRVSTSAGLAYAGAGSSTTAADLLELADHRMLTTKVSRRGR